MPYSKRPKDVTQYASWSATCSPARCPTTKNEILNPPEAPEPHGRQLGGLARAEALTPGRRQEIAQKAAATRWRE